MSRSIDPPRTTTASRSLVDLNSRRVRQARRRQQEERREAENQDIGDRSIGDPHELRFSLW